MAARLPPAWRQTLSFVPGIDGLRALAVIVVILYHADLTWFPGGFLGVEAFFVISGFLITSLLLGEWQGRGAIDFKAFWIRRARRLLPAVFLMILVTLTYAVFFLPQEIAGLRLDALAALGYATNWYLVVASQSYFEFMGRPSLLRHLWSLAVEEQFYVFWPLLFAIGIRLLRRRGLLFAILAGIVASTVWMAMLYQPEVDSARIYFGTDTRAAGLLVGAALAFVWSPWRLPARAGLARSLSLDAVGLGALGLLIWLFCKLDEFQPFLYRGGFLLVDLATAAALAVVVHPHAHLGRGLLAWQPLRWVGTRSYGIYLWHWPIFMITRPHLDVSIDGMPLLLLRLGATMLLAELSYRYVETPFRRGAFGRALTAWSKARMTGRWWKILYRQPLSQVTGHQRPYQYRESGQ